MFHTNQFHHSQLLLFFFVISEWYSNNMEEVGYYILLPDTMPIMTRNAFISFHVLIRTYKKNLLITKLGLQDLRSHTGQIVF